ncbi:MAG: hypothetical protein INR70_05905 [Parafilimonas terrae]|nr:hypothetical protein [Parafilimonas terrae]
MQLLRGQDAPFSFRHAAPEAAIEALGLTPGRTKDDRAVQAGVIAAAAIEHDGDGRWISYSRSHDWWAAGRYEGTPVTMLRVIRTVEELAAKGLVESFVQMPGAHLLSNEAERTQSAFRAWPALVNRLGGLRLDPVKRPPVIMKDEAGNRIAFPRTERGARATREMEDLNSWFAGFDVEVDPKADPANWRRSAYHLHARKVKDGKETWSCTIPGTPRVVRIFGRGRLDMHGRCYGWWQPLPKDRRLELLINGEVLIEEDFACLHPTLLYAMKGIKLDFDPYDAWGFPRQYGKWALNIAVNADGGLKGAVDALMAKPDWTESRTYTRKLVDEVAKRNEPIREFLGSDAGVRLMAIDSRMALDVLKGCRKAGIAALPVHDSFMAPAGKAGQVRAIMGEALDKARVTISPNVSISSTLPFLHNAPLADPSLPSPPVEAPVPAGVSPPVPPAPSWTLAPSTPLLDPRTCPAPSSRTRAPTHYPDPRTPALAAPSASSIPDPRVSTRPLAPAVPDLPWTSPDLSPDPRIPVPVPGSMTSLPVPRSPVRDGRTASSTSPAFPDPSGPAPALPDLPCTLRLDMTDSHPIVVAIPDPHPCRIYDLDGTEVRGLPVMLRPLAEELISQGYDPYTRPAAPPPKVASGLPEGIIPRGVWPYTSATG